MKTDRAWIHSGLDETVHSALAQGMPATQLWSLLLGIVESRAAQRTPAAVFRQWSTDRFVAPSYMDQRTFNELDAHLLAAASEFEAIELSPLAPLGTCASVARTTQNRIVSTTRGTEVVSDPTNVLALESARRLREDGSRVVRLATSHRCVRAQEVPAVPGYAAHFRMFCMTTAGRERKDQAFRTDSILHHIRTHLDALTRLEAHGYSFASRTIKLLATRECEHLSQRIAAAIEGVEVAHEPLNHGYYDGLRFMISARNLNGDAIPLIDGGSFDWVGKIAANSKLVFVASAIGSQLAAYLYRRPTA